MPTVIADRSDVLGVPTDGCTINAYKASRFGSPPALGAASPGTPDAGPILSGPANGQTGGVRITVPTVEDYYCSFQAPTGGQLSWGGPYHALASSTIASITAADTTIVIGGTGTNPTVGVGTITNAQISNTAGIAKAKLAALAVVDADVASNAAIAISKLATPSNFGIIGANAASGGVSGGRYLGLVPSGGPTSPLVCTVGDFGMDSSGFTWTCIVAGTPGTWVAVGRATTAAIFTSETTTSTAYADLTTLGPAVTVITGATAMVTVSGNLANSVAAGISAMGFAVSGASTMAANDNAALALSVATANLPNQASFAMQVQGLTPGNNTFTAKYRVTAGTGTFVNRRIVVAPA